MPLTHLTPDTALVIVMHNPNTTELLVTYAGYVIVALVSWNLLKVIRTLWRGTRSPLHKLPGPLEGQFLSLEGDMHDFRDTYIHGAKRLRWFKEYGRTFAFRGFLGAPTLLTFDPVALNHILTNPIFEKPSEVAYTLARSVGPGVFVVEGDVHKHQRRVMNPAFGPVHIREMTEIFVDIATHLETILEAKIKHAGGNLHTDMLMWLNRATLDMIGLAGFGYQFNALSDSEPSELSVVLSTMFKAGTSPFSQLQSAVPILRWVPTSDGRALKKAQAALNKIGVKLLADAKTVAMSSDGENTHKDRSLLSLLIHANLVEDGPKLTDEAVLAQVPTFFVAGHETTSNAVAWTLFALSQAPDVQKKLRQELRSLPSRHPTMDQLNSLPYLENVIREVLRFHSPVPGTMRIATEDVVVPVSEPYLDRHGKKRSEIRMAKGDPLILPIDAMNRLEDIWGPDAGQFNPNRWNNLPDKVKTLPGVYSNMLSFLGGPHACIGYRFAIVEWKAIIFALLRSFEFELALSGKEIDSNSSIVQSPFLKGDRTRKHQLPMVVRFSGQEN